MKKPKTNKYNKQERKKTKQNTKRDANLLKKKTKQTVIIYNKQKGKVTIKYSHMFGVVTEKIFSILQRPKLSKRVCLFAAAHSALFSYCCRETKRCCGDYDVNDTRKLAECARVQKVLPEQASTPQQRTRSYMGVPPYCINCFPFQRKTGAVIISHSN